MSCMYRCTAGSKKMNMHSMHPYKTEIMERQKDVVSYFFPSLLSFFLVDSHPVYLSQMNRSLIQYEQSNVEISSNPLNLLVKQHRPNLARCLPKIILNSDQVLHLFLQEFLTTTRRKEDEGLGERDTIEYHLKRERKQKMLEGHEERASGQQCWWTIMIALVVFLLAH